MGNEITMETEVRREERSFERAIRRERINPGTMNEKPAMGE